MQYYDQNPENNRPSSNPYTPPPPYQAPPTPNYEAHYQTPHSLRYDPAPPAKKKSALPKVLASTALVLACAVAGFGGSYVALETFGADRPVVYRSAGGSASAAGVSTGGEKTISDIAAASGPSVVSITTENLVTDVFAGQQVASGAGSGVIISADGTILTNHHVIDGANSIKVTLQDGTEYDAKLVGSDSATDVAVLKVEASGLSPAVLADSGSIAVGDFCIAIGNPMGTLGGTVTDGIISALNREITIQGTPMTLLQMSAPVSPGNSGGGLFNASGELVGLVNAKSGGSGAEGLGFAIPINTAMKVADEILTHGYVTGRPILGLSAVEITTPEEAAYAGVDAPGLYVANVLEGGSAAAAGLQGGDRIVRFEGKEIDTLSGLSTALGEHNPGDTVTLVISRAGQENEVQITLQERQPNNV